MHRMGKFTLYCLIILSLFALFSCRPKPEEAPVAEEIEIPAPEIIGASVREDRLRVRSLPYLDQEIVGYLMSGDRIIVESKTEWLEDIADMSSPWYFVRTDAYAGWTYGGFLDFPEGNESSVPTDPAVPPAEVELVQRPGSPLDPKNLPEILLPVFGLEGEPVHPGSNEGSISYDSLHELLLLPLSSSPDSRLSEIISDGKSKLRIVAESPGKARYTRVFNRNELNLLSDSIFPSSGGRDAIMLPFYHLAILDKGAWEIYAFIGEETWPAAVGRIKVEPSEVSLVPVREPDPLSHSPRSRYSRGDTVWCYGNSPAEAKGLQMALYHDTEESREGMVLLKPVLGRNIVAGDDGSWSVSFSLDSLFPEGRCWVAVGSPIEGLDNLLVFTTSLEL